MSVIGRAPTDTTRALLEAARRGDEGAYGMLVEPHRAELHAHCYQDARLGSRRRGRAPGGAPARLARATRLRGSKLAAVVALQDRDERVPAGDRAPAEADAPDRPRAGRRSRRPSRRAARG